jgi:signal transduction histidine kinase
MRSATSDWVRQWVLRRFGRSTRASLDIARVSVALAGIAPCLFMDPRSLPLSCFLFALMLAWAIFVAVMPLLSWQRDIRASALVLTIDFGIIGAIIALSSTLTLVALPYALLLFLLLQGVFFRVLQAIIIIAVIAILATFGTTAEPVVGHGAVDTAVIIERSVFVGLSLLTFATIRTRRSYRRELRIWSEGLLIAGTHAQRVPLDFIVDQLAQVYGDRPMLWIVNEGDDDPGAFVREAGGLAELRLPDKQWKGARAALASERAFMFDAQDRRFVHHVEIERPGVGGAEAVFDLIDALGLASKGVAIPVRTAEVSARILIGLDERPSIPALREAIEVGHAIEAVFERYTFQSAWRDRAYSEARMALGRDLHDSVLQTMASLRMQIATLLSDRKLVAAGPVRDAIEHLQTTVASEQASFREMLDESRRASTQQVELNQVLDERVRSLSAQWHIDCRLTPTEEPLMVDANAAVEVEFIVREVVSNAAQHGGAKTISIRLSLAGDTLLLSVTNDQKAGKLGPAQDDRIRSQSLARRLTYLRATAYGQDLGGGALLSIRIPLART